MILTNARRDCAQLTLDMLVASGSLSVFNHVVFLLNGVSPAHTRFVDGFIKAHPGVSFDKILGSGIRPDGISEMQNECIRKYPDSLYMKVDEDVFVPHGWAHRMVEAYEANRHRDNLALITPLLPNNSWGLFTLCHTFYPHLLAEYRERFNGEPEPERAGRTWINPHIAEWATRSFLNLKESNARHSQLMAEKQLPRYVAFSRPFSIGCIAYDYRHVERMGGVPLTDEPGWCDWVEKNNQTHILDCSQIALHYSFFVQQEWLDRSSLLEDIRAANLPDTIGPFALATNKFKRRAGQLPSILKRKLSKFQS